jgi:hypothetical protein
MQNKADHLSYVYFHSMLDDRFIARSASIRAAGWTKAVEKARCELDRMKATADRLLAQPVYPRHMGPSRDDLR